MSPRDLSADSDRLVDRRHDKAAKNQTRSSRTPKFHTIAQVAEMLGVSSRTVHRWIKDGHLGVLRVGSVVRIGDADLKAFVAIHHEH